MIEQLMQSPLWNLVASVMLHYLWLGAVAGLLAQGLAQTLAYLRCPARWRYVAALSSLVALALLPLAIAAVLLQQEPSWSPLQPSRPHVVELNVPSDTASASATARPIRPPAAIGVDGGAPEPAGEFTIPPAQKTGAAVGRATAAARRYLPWAWLAGTPLTLVLVTAGVFGADRLRRDSVVLEQGPAVDALNRLASRLNLRALPGIAVCPRLGVPVLVGILRPVILIPPSVLTGWSAAELELLLLHELAHIRRRDNMINLGQRFVEAALFYQPAIWTVSAWVRREREHCCDDFVIAQSGMRKPYARLLADLAEDPQRLGDLATTSMARRDVVARIRHIVNSGEPTMRVSNRMLAILAGCLLVLGLGTWYAVLPPAQAQDPPLAADDGESKALKNGDAGVGPSASGGDAGGDRPGVPTGASGAAELPGLAPPGLVAASSNAGLGKRNDEGDISGGIGPAGLPGLELGIEGAGGAGLGGLGVVVQGEAAAGKTVLVAVVQFSDSRELWLRLPTGKLAKLRPDQSIRIHDREWRVERIADDHAEIRQGDKRIKLRIGQALVEATPQPKISRDALRYDGQTFAQWSSIWRTELKPELRIEALRALLQFGTNGYSSEAARTVLEMAGHYRITNYRSNSLPSGSVLEMARETLLRIGPTSLPIITESLLSGSNENQRHFACYVLRTSRWDLTAEVASLVKATRDPSDSIRVDAIAMLQHHAHQPAVQSALVQAAAHQDARTRTAAYSAMLHVRSNQMPKEMLQRLIAGTRDKDLGVRRTAYSTLTSYSFAGGESGMAMRGMGMDMGSGMSPFGGDGGYPGMSGGGGGIPGFGGPGGGMGAGPPALPTFLDQFPQDEAQQIQFLLNLMQTRSELRGQVMGMLSRYGKAAHPAIDNLLKTTKDKKLAQLLRIVRGAKKDAEKPPAQP